MSTGHHSIFEAKQVNPRSGKETGVTVMIKFFDGTTGDSYDREIKFHDMLVARGKATASSRYITKMLDHVFDGQEVEIFGNKGRAIAYEKADRSFADWCNFPARNNTNTSKNAVFANQVSGVNLNFHHHVARVSFECFDAPAAHPIHLCII